MAEYVEPEDIDFKEAIGDGASAVVYRAIWDGKIVAVKKFERSCSMSTANEFKKEINIISNLDHENVIKFYGFCNKRNNTFLITELMEGGSLYEYIHSDTYDNKYFTDFYRTLHLITGIVNGMIYLHDKSILHLDLKSANVLLNGYKTTAKINDFGLSKISTLTSTTTNVNKTAKGTIRYMAPEIAKGLDGNKGSDVWGFGCILLELATKEVPFKNFQDNIIFRFLQNDDIQLLLNASDNVPNIPKLLKKLIDESLKLKNRPTFLEIKELIKSNQRINSSFDGSIKTSQDGKKTDDNDSEYLKKLADKIHSNKLENKMLKCRIKELEENLMKLNIKIELEKKKEEEIKDQFWSIPSYNRISSPLPLQTVPTKISISTPFSFPNSSAIPTGEKFVSRGSANGRDIFMGPRGGRFYYTPSGGKRYV